MTIFSKKDLSRIATQLAETGEAIIKKATPAKTSIKNPRLKPFAVSQSIEDVFVGVGVELLLKSTYLAAGYDIFNHRSEKIRELHSFEKLGQKFELNTDKSVAFKRMIKSCELIFTNKDNKEIQKIKQGLEMIADWRNESAHGMAYVKSRTGEQIKLSTAVLKELNSLNIQQLLKLQKSVKSFRN